MCGECLLLVVCGEGLGLTVCGECLGLDGYFTSRSLRHGTNSTQIIPTMVRIITSF